VQLPAERAAVDEDRAQVHPGGIEAGGEARGTAADDDHIEEFNHVLLNRLEGSSYSGEPPPLKAGPRGAPFGLDSTGRELAISANSSTDGRHGRPEAAHAATAPRIKLVIRGSRSG